MKSRLPITLLALVAAVTPARAQDTPVLEQLAAHNVIWDSPSEDMHGSMPIGNGDLAANFWVEPTGDLVFYLSKSDSWDGDQELLKLGRVRIRLDKPFVRDGRPFRQELDLARGCIVVESGVGEDKTTVDFWIDANRPVVNVQIKGAEAFTAQVALEHWPQETNANRPTLKTDIAKDAAGAWRGDTILPAEDNTIRWYHRNTESIFAETLKKQHLGHAVGKFHDPLLNLTFGGLIAGKGLVTKDDKTLATAAPVKSIDIRIHALTAQTPEAAAWVSQLGTLRAANDQVAASEARPAHEQWWKDFWNRSWIFPGGTEEAKAVGRAYALQRWIQAGAGRGAYPIKFNGSLFSVDGLMNKKGGTDEFGPDWRRWGGGYWFQNTRLPYWAMLYSGDFDQMEPLWKMYRDAVPLLKERTKTYFKHDGIFCSETMHPWGLNKQGDFGYNNPEFYPANSFIRRYWDSGNELAQMMLDRYAHAPSEEFAKTTLVPIADGVVTFYEQHYPKPEPGKPRFAPAMSLETWHTAEDPAPVIVGLRTVLTRLLELPESLTTPEQRAKWARFLAELPETPMAGENGKKWLLPARTFSNKRNSENPELYAVFPYRVYGLGKPDREVALETWNRRLVKATGGWRQDSIQAALLGLTDEAKGYVVRNATEPTLIGPLPHKPSRFPAFWGPNFDGTPDQCQGSVTLIALQRMLMQCDGDTIRLVPAWPKDWNASFKLHAPKNTTVEGRVENGKLADLKVTPESRRKDVVVGAILENGESKTDSPDARPAFVEPGSRNVPVDGGNPIATPPATGLGSPGQAISKPNVIIILADDLGYGDVKCYNPERGKIPTPNIDKLASQGMRFTDAHASSGVCSPTRYTLLTGRYHWRSRLQSYVLNYLDGPLIAPGRLTLAGLLKQHGYRTGAIGKWHLGWDFRLTADERKRLHSYGGKAGGGDKVKTAATDADLAAWRTIFSRQFLGGPLACGFDSYFGTDVPNFPPYCFIENDRTVGIPSELLAADAFRNNQADIQGPALAGWKLEGVLPALGERACAFIQNAAKAPEPFFLYLPLTAPHYPIATTKEWRGKSGLNDYADFVMQTDATVGRVLQALEESGAAQNTLVVFTSDNGFAPHVGAAELEGKGHFPSGPLRGYKGDAWEGGHRVPFIVRWPGKVKPGTRCDALVSQADLIATLAETLDAKLPGNAGEDSFSLIPLLQGGNKPVREYAISHAMNGLPALRKGSWKIIFGKMGGGFKKAPESAATGQLYDLATDLGETKNLWDEQPELVAGLAATMSRLVADGRSTPGERQQNDVPVRWQRFLERPSPPSRGKGPGTQGTRPQVKERI